MIQAIKAVGMVKEALSSRGWSESEVEQLINAVRRTGDNIVRKRNIETIKKVSDFGKVLPKEENNRTVDLYA